MLTCWSDSARVTSESSRARSSASTWMLTRKTLVAFGAQVDGHDAVGLLPQRRDVDAVGAVHGDAVPAGHEPEHVVAGHGRAAAGELHPDVVVAVDHDAGVALRARLAGRDARRGDDLGEVLGGAVGAAVRLHEPLHDGGRRDAALADGGVQRGDVRVVQLGEQRGERRVGQQPVQRQAGLAHRAGDRVLAVLDRLVAALLGEPGLDLRAGAGALDELQPVAVGPGVLGLRGEHLDDVAGGQRRLQRHELAVDARADAAVARPRCARRRRSRPGSSRRAARRRRPWA